ncbi:hypothetical protein S245_045330, partial [Arachis hypogaea]
RLCTSILVRMLLCLLKLLVLHPNGRPFITFLGVAPACFPVPFVGFDAFRMLLCYKYEVLRAKTVVV